MAEFGYIVVGAGSVLADRLTGAPDCGVLVLEAGGERLPQAALDPKLWPSMPGTDVDYRTAPVTSSR